MNKIFGIAAVIVAMVSPISPPNSTVVIRPVTVPLLRVGGLPAVNAVINGSKAYPFVIDTAANVLAISPRWAREWKLPAIGKDEMGNLTMRMRELSVGAASFRGLVAVADPFLGGRDEAGVLGINIFRDVVLSIDFARNTVTFALGRLPPANGVDILVYKPSEGGAPTIQISICGMKVAVGIDTAAPAVLRLPKSLMSDIRCDRHVVGSHETIGAQAGPSRVTDARLGGDLRFANIRLRYPVVRFGDGPALFIGSGALAGVVLTVDQQHRLLRLTRAGN